VRDIGKSFSKKQPVHNLRSRSKRGGGQLPLFRGIDPVWSVPEIAAKSLGPDWPRVQKKCDKEEGGKQRLWRIEWISFIPMQGVMPMGIFQRRGNHRQNPFLMRIVEA